MEVEEQEQKEQQKTETPKEKAEESKPTSSIQKIDSFIKFKAPSQKSPKKQKIEASQNKTPVKIDVLEEVAMPSWSDNSSSDIIKPKGEAMDVQTAQGSNIIEIEDSEDMKLVYDESQSQSPIEPKSANSQVSPEPKKESPKPLTPKSDPTKSGDSNFLQQAKVTDARRAAPAAAPSPKAPRRVSFVTLSSPKNAKKKWES